MEVMMTSVKDISTHPGIDLLSRATIRGNHNTDLKLAQMALLHERPRHLVKFNARSYVCPVVSNKVNVFFIFISLLFSDYLDYQSELTRMLRDRINLLLLFALHLLLYLATYSLLI